MNFIDTLTKIAGHVDFLEVLDRDEEHEDYISSGGKYAWVYQLAHFVASVAVGLLERVERERVRVPPPPTEPEEAVIAVGS